MSNIMGSQIIALISTLSFLGVVFICLSIIKNKFSLPAEISRKAIHITLGLTTLSFPYIFKETWIVWLMCVISVLALSIVKYSPLRKSFGKTLHEVDRSSYGDILFPISVAILFQLTSQEPVFYIVSILVLTLADAFAAIIGVYYGKAHYDASEGIKSIEGSLGFFVTAFLCIQIPLLTMSHFDNSSIILVSAFIALLITLCEAVSWQGLDNLFIPLGVYITLTNYLHYQVSTLIILSVSLIMILIIGVSFRNKSTMNFSALIFSIVLGFLYITLDPESVIIPLLMFVLYSYIIRKEHTLLINKHNVLSILYLNLGGLFWEFLKANGHEGLILDFSIYYCIQTGLISWIHNHYFYRKFCIVKPVIISTVLFTIVFCMYAKELHIFTYKNYLIYLCYMILSLFTSLFLFYMWCKNKEELTLSRERLIFQGGIAFVGSLIFYVLRSMYA